MDHVFLSSLYCSVAMHCKEDCYVDDAKMYAADSRGKSVRFFLRYSVPIVEEVHINRLDWLDGHSGYHR